MCLIEACIWICTFSEEILMTPWSRYMCILDTIYPISSWDSTHTMRDKYDDFILLLFEEFIHHDNLILSIELIRPFIHDDYRSILKEESNKCEYLFFSSGKINLLSDSTIQSFKTFPDFISEAESLEVIPESLIRNCPHS